MDDDATVPQPKTLIRKLESISPLTREEKQTLLNLPMAVRAIPADQDIVSEGDRPSECCLILEGFVSRYKLTREGRRQIMSFHLPGDTPDILSLHLGTMDHSLGTLVPCKLGFIPHDTMREVLRKHPGLADVFWRDTLIDAAVFREWMLVGRRSAYTRIAHLLCELFTRFEAVGLAKDFAFALPITQTEVGDALGLSTVHVNESSSRSSGTGSSSCAGDPRPFRTGTASSRQESSTSATFTCDGTARLHDLGAPGGFGLRRARTRRAVSSCAEAGWWRSSSASRAA